VRRVIAIAASVACAAVAVTCASTAAAARKTPTPKAAASARTELRLAELSASRLARILPHNLIRAARRSNDARVAPTPGISTVSEKPTAIAAKPSVVLPNDPDWSQEWGLQQVGAPLAWGLLTSSRPVVVAVVDSGVDPTQPDLQGALVAGADFADGTGSTADQFGHGTMVAGVIAARGDNGQGVAGACWSCLVMPVKVLDANGVGTAQGVAAGITWAADHGANVINMSFVLSGPDQGVADAVAYAESQGVVVVAAAGNAGGTDPTYPASYPGVVSVAGTDPAGNLYPWSSYGPWVSVAAPGCNLSTLMGGGVGQFCGTSAAAPLVAGLAGLAFEAGAQDAAQVVAALEQTTSAVPGPVATGRVDAASLVERLAPANEDFELLR
jgi:subtilisin family serine protease